MLGFKKVLNACVVIAGIEFAEKIKNQHYDLRRIGGMQPQPRRNVAAHHGCLGERPVSPPHSSCPVRPIRCLQQNLQPRNSSTNGSLISDSGVRASTAAPLPGTVRERLYANVAI